MAIRVPCSTTSKWSARNAILEVQHWSCISKIAGITNHPELPCLAEFTPYGDSRRGHVTPLSAKNSASLAIAS